MAILAAAYVALPVMLSNWGYFNCRLVPFLWAGLALRLPGTLPRPVAIVLAACALSFSAVTGIDYVRLDRDRAEFTAGIDAVPERATLLPLAVQAQQDQRLHRQPDARLGLLHGGEETRRRRWCSRWSAPTRSRTGTFRRAR